MEPSPAVVTLTFGSHLDLFWMGTHEECLERGARILLAALDLIERDPEYCYYIETAVFAEYFLREHPGEKPRMARFLREGRLEIGGCYVDRVEHLHDGESLIRHAVVGVRWMRETFGISPRTVTHPDLPGITPQIPQIYAKAGIRAYLRARRFGYLFDWVSPDGSRLLYANLWGYGSKSLDDYLQPLAQGDYPSRFLLRGGYSDLEFPRADSMETVRRLREAEPRHIFEVASPDSLIDRISLDSLPKLQGEMPFGWGSIPSAFVETFRLSVDLERTLLAAERWMSVAQRMGLPVAPASPRESEASGRAWSGLRRVKGTVVYGDPSPPGEELNELWRYELFTQDHNYGGHHGAQSEFDKRAMKRAALEETERWMHGAMDAIASKITGASEESVVLFNPLSWDRDSIARWECEDPETAAIVDSEGNPALSQPDEGGLAIAARIPSLGYRAFSVIRKPPSAPSAPPSDHLRSPFMEARLDVERGHLVSLTDRVHDRDLIDPSAPAAMGEVVSYEDPGVDVRYAFTGRSVSDRASGYRIKSASSGDLFERVTLESVFLDAKIEKSFTFYRHQPRLDVRLKLFWWGKTGEHLRLSFPFRREDFRETWYGVPFCAMRWPEMLSGDADEEILSQNLQATDMLYPDDRLHFREVIGWLDAAYDGWGIALGTRHPTFWIDGGFLQAVLLRTQFSCGDANLWNRNAGEHEWNFRIVPHEGDWRESHAYRIGEETLMPTVAHRFSGAGDPAAEGALPPSLRFVAVEPESVAVAAFKPSDVEAGAHLLRLLERAGQPTTAVAKLAGDAHSAWDANLLEEDGRELPVTGEGIRVDLKPHEFKTIIIRSRSR